jgi:hypothetical protein
MEHAWIAGKPAALDTAIAEAAKLLASSPHPLIAGLGTDVAGARAAIAPAEPVGAVVIDHLHADALYNSVDYPVTVSKSQPVAVDNKYDPNPAVRVDITVDNKGFTVAHHMANGITYVRGERYGVDAFQIDKSDPNLVIWIGRRRNDPNVVMVGYLQYVPDATEDKWHYWEVVANRAKPWTIDHPELVSSCWGS